MDDLLVTMCGWGTTLIVAQEVFCLKLKLFNLTGIAGSYLILAPLRENPPLKQQKKCTVISDNALMYTL